MVLGLPTEKLVLLTKLGVCNNVSEWNQYE